MGNSRASLGHMLLSVNPADKEEVYNSLYGILSCDNDLTENEDYFQDDTLDLGFESEADRIVKENLKDYTPGRYDEVATKVSDSIAKQEYYGQCSIDFIKIGDEQIIMSFVYGGDYGN